MNKFLFHNGLRYRIGRHLVFFATLVIIFTLVLYSRSNGGHFFNLLKLTFINALIFLGYGYLTVFILIPVFLPDRKFVLFALSFLALGFLLSALKLSISGFIFYSSIAPEFVGSEGLINLRFILINTKDMSFIAGLFVVVKFTKNWLIAENQHRSLERKYADLNLMKLQSHFEPHFLFNTLNNLYALSLSNQEKTLEVIRRFKRVLSFSITESQKKRVPLLLENEMIADFIEIEKIRYGSRLHLKYRVTGNCEGLVIAPFLLFPLVENCFKHGSSADAGKPWIEISQNCRSGKISFETANSVPKRVHLPVSHQENGLFKFRQRLELIYPKKYKLELSEEEEKFTVKLELDLN